MKEIKRVGVIGAGTMGQGIAQACAMNGFEVVLYDVNSTFLTKAITAIEATLNIAAEKGKITKEQKISTLQKISPTSSVSEIKVDLIIEAVIEELKVKQNLLKEIESINNEDCIITTNTSSIPITKIATALKNPSRFAGLHFFNPAHLMKLVEVIEGASTDNNITKALISFSEKIGKRAVVVKDSPGFIVNRVARHFYVESLKILEENVTDIRSIDALLKSSGFKMGAFELMDLIGVDVNLSVTTSIYNGFNQDSKFAPNRIQQQKVDAGCFGRKSGKGFYDYRS